MFEERINETNTFWQNVLNSWLEVIIGLKLSKIIKKHFLNMLVWYNSEITVNNNYVFIKLRYQKCIRVIGDFLDEN